MGTKRKYVKYNKSMLEEAAKNSFSVAGVVKLLGLKLAGGTQAYISKKLKDFNINTSHFTGQGHLKGKHSSNRAKADDILVVRQEGQLREKPHRLRRALLEKGITYECNQCGIGNIWNNKPITLEINHIDGNWLNNQILNLEFLCPNCHSQDTNANMPHKYR
jgi:predicted RNA-binding Zn-ribbon protein involved in translation (DUF1610 family)